MICFFDVSQTHLHLIPKQAQTLQATQTNALLQSRSIREVTFEWNEMGAAVQRTRHASPKLGKLDLTECGKWLKQARDCRQLRLRE